MPLTTFSKATFKDELFDHLDGLFDMAAERDEQLADHVFLGQLYRMAANQDTHVSQLIKMIQDYVNHTKRTGAVVNELYQLIQFDFKHNLNFLIESVDDDPVKKDEFVQLIMTHWCQEGRFNGYLMNNDNPELKTLPPMTTPEGAILIPSIAALYHRLNEIIANDTSESGRIQVIVRQNEHYTPIDIDKARRSCFVIDAAGDAKELILRDFVNYSPYIDKLCYVAQHEYLIPDELLRADTPNATTISRVQKDKFSCSIFSLQYARLVAAEEDLHASVFEKATCMDEHQQTLYSIPWDTLNPEYIRLSQSPTYKTYYAQHHHLSPINSNGFYAIQTELKSMAESMLLQFSEHELRRMVTPRYTPSPLLYREDIASPPKIMELSGMSFS